MSDAVNRAYQRCSGRGRGILKIPEHVRDMIYIYITPRLTEDEAGFVQREPATAKPAP